MMIRLHHIDLYEGLMIGADLISTIDAKGMHRLHDGTNFRGYVLDEFGLFRADAWGPGGKFRRRGYKTEAGAVRAMERNGLRLAGEA